MTHNIPEFDKMDWLDATLRQISETAKAKNADYSCDTDWMGNFKRYGIFGMMARMHDKVQRAENLLLKGHVAQVDEAVGDTLLDLATYALLIRQAYAEKLSIHGNFTDTTGRVKCPQCGAKYLVKDNGAHT